MWVTPSHSWRFNDVDSSTFTRLQRWRKRDPEDSSGLLKIIWNKAQDLGPAVFTCLHCSCHVPHIELAHGAPRP